MKYLGIIKPAVIALFTLSLIFLLVWPERIYPISVLLFYVTLIAFIILLGAAIYSGYHHEEDIDDFFDEFIP